MRFVALIVAAGLASVATPAFADECDVSAPQREAARQLDWQVFDQEGGAPGSFRDLSGKRCYGAALAAYRDWLEHGPGFQDERQRAIGTFHIAQLLAFLGDTQTAVRFFNQSSRSDDGEDPFAVEWNLYVAGVLAFFAGDRDAMSGQIEALGALDTQGSERWTSRLEGLRRCLREDYRKAMSPRCQRG